MSRKFFSVTRPAQSGKRCQLPAFPLNVIITSVHTLSSHVHWEPCDSLIKDIQVAFLQVVLRGTYSWVSFSDICKEGPSLNLESWTQQTFFLVNKYTCFYLFPIGYLFVKLLMRKLLVCGMGQRINHVPYMHISWVTSLLALRTTIVQPTKLIYNLMLPNLV